MTNENKIKDDLLSQTEPNEIKNKKSIQEIIDRDTKRVNRLKIITIVSWSLDGLLLASVFIIQKFYGKLHSPQTGFEAIEQLAVPALMLTFRAVLFISIFLTISFYVRSKNLSIKQINSRLANIEEQLRNVLQSK
jgi:hypothetical protein